MTINERVKNLIEDLNISPTDFAKKIKVNSNQVIYNILKNRNRPNAETIEAILFTYKNLNARWLILGEGEKWAEYKEMYSTANEPETKYLTKPQGALEQLQNDVQLIREDVNIIKEKLGIN